MHFSPFGPANEMTMSLLLEQRSGEINMMKRCERADERCERAHGERRGSATEDNSEKERERREESETERGIV